MNAMHEALTGPSGALCFLAALRWLWLLPDWLAKWQALVAYRRDSHGSAHPDLRRATPPP
jgi:hypothetical protein